MSTPFIGEIRMFGGNFAPAGWAFCDGSALPISENDTLFTLIGTTFGGDGQETFNLPDLRGRIPVHHGYEYVFGETGGVESVTLTPSQIATHSHTPLANDNGSGARKSTPKNGIWANSGQIAYSSAPPTPTRAMRANIVMPTGGSQPHDNMHPFLVITFIISLYGIFPTLG